MTELSKKTMATQALEGLSAKGSMTAEQVRGGKHEANTCGEPLECGGVTR